MADETFVTIQPPLKAVDNGDGTFSVSILDVNSAALLAALLAVRDVSTLDTVEAAIVAKRSTEWLIEVQKGNIPGHRIKHKFGRNDAVPNGTWAFIDQLGLTAWPLSAATTVRIKAGGNVADVAGGAGATEITIQGLDDSFNEVEEAIATNGSSASLATTISFWRVHRAWVSGVGTYGAANTANIDIENSGGGTDLIRIAADEGQTQYGGYTIPVNKTGYLLTTTITVDAAKPADVRMYQRKNIDDVAAPMSSKRLKTYFDGLMGVFTFAPHSPQGAMAAKTDIWFEARGSGGAGTEVSVDFEILLVDD